MYGFSGLSLVSSITFLFFKLFTINYLSQEDFIIKKIILKLLEKLSDEIISKCPCLVNSYYSKECYKLIQISQSKKLNTAWATELASIVYDMCFSLQRFGTNLATQSRREI